MKQPFVLIFALCILWACKNPAGSGSTYTEKDGFVYYNGSKTNHLLCQLKSDPENLWMMRPATSAHRDMWSLVHASLYDFKPDGSVAPFLAKGPYQRSADGLGYEVEIHEAAKWEDRTPITAEDVLFSLKLYLCPLLGNSALASYLEYIKDVTIDPQNPKKFRLDTKSYYVGNDWILASFFIVDKRLYDKQRVLDSYSLQTFLDQNRKWEKDAALVALAKEFTDAKWGTQPEYVQGAGAYRLESLKQGEAFQFVRKNNYWAKSLKQPHLAAYPDTLTFRLIKDEAALEIALRQGQLDFTHGISAPAFKRLQADNLMQQDYRFYTGTRNTTACMFLNTRPDGKKRPKIFDDKWVRQAVAYLMPLDNMIETYLEGFAVRTTSLMSLDSKFYNQQLKPYAYNPAKADSLLKAAGWKDSDGDKVLDKQIDGKKQALSITLYYSKGMKTAEAMFLRAQSELQKAGFACKVEMLEQNILNEKMKNHDFDVLFNGLGNFHDFKEVFHSTSYQNGSNFTGWGNAQSDRLIDRARITADDSQRKLALDSLQQLIYEDCPVIYFYKSKGRAVIHKRFNGGDQLNFDNPQVQRLEMRKG